MALLGAKATLFSVGGAAATVEVPPDNAERGAPATVVVGASAAATAPHPFGVTEVPGPTVVAAVNPFSSVFSTPLADVTRFGPSPSPHVAATTGKVMPTFLTTSSSPVRAQALHAPSAAAVTATSVATDQALGGVNAVATTSPAVSVVPLPGLAYVHAHAWPAGAVVCRKCARSPQQIATGPDHQRLCAAPDPGPGWRHAIVSPAPAALLPGMQCTCSVLGFFKKISSIFSGILFCLFRFVSRKPKHTRSIFHQK